MENYTLTNLPGIVPSATIKRIVKLSLKVQIKKIEDRIERLSE